jgi:hypothetical protein
MLQKMQLLVVEMIVVKMRKVKKKWNSNMMMTHRQRIMILSKRRKSGKR